MWIRAVNCWAIALVLLGVGVGRAAMAEPSSARSLADSEQVHEATEIEPNVVSGGEGDEIDPNVVGYDDYRDPLIHVNRAVFAFNDVTYRYALIPLGKQYVRVVPEPVRQGLGRFFDNLREPGYAVNHLLQLEPRASGRNLSRFTINTTLGVAGIFDRALDWFELERAETGFDETLAFLGAGYGIYLVLPFAGPSDARGFASRLVDYYLSPVPYLTEPPVAAAITSGDAFQDYAPTADEYEKLRRETQDAYLFFRNLHLQGILRDEAY